MNIPKNVRLFLEERANAQAIGNYSSLLCEIEEQLEILEEKETPMVSPVEQMFFIEWYARRYGRDTADVEDRFDLMPQYQLEHLTGKYRLDFSVEFLTGVVNCPTDSVYNHRELEIFEKVRAPLLGIEIDGHEWHERNKEQAQRDKSRERFLVANGWKILRFTGSEVFKDSGKCVTETIDCATTLARIWHQQIRGYLLGKA